MQAHLQPPTVSGTWAARRNDAKTMSNRKKQLLEVVQKLAAPRRRLPALVPPFEQSAGLGLQVGMQDRGGRGGRPALRDPAVRGHVADDLDQVIALDGAHTPAAARALVETWRAEIGDTPVTVIAGMGNDKDLRAFLGELAPITARGNQTRAGSPRAASPQDIATAATALGLPVQITPDVESALKLAANDSPLLVTGTLFVAGEVREALGLAEPDLEWAAINAAHLAATSAP